MPDSALARRLRRHLEGPVRFDALTRGLYATDASIYQIMPLGVVLPRTLDDASAAIAIAREEGVPVLPRGAGTSQCGQTVGRAVVIDCSRHLDRILEVDPEARTATVEPGVVLDHLNRHLAGTGLFFPVDVATASRATIGGMAGNNSGGARSIRYGIMADNVVALEAALADGRVADFGGESRIRGGCADGRRATAGADPGGNAAAETTKSTPARLAAAELASTLDRIARREADELAARVPRVLRHVAGYPLHRLLNPDASPAEALIGSEGTLAFFRTLTLKLSPRPSRRVLGICAFPSLQAALDAVQHLVELDPHAVELVDQRMIALARGHPSFRATVEAHVPESAHTALLVEFAGDGETPLAGRLARLEELVRTMGPGRRVARAEAESEQAAVWRVRKAALNIAMSMKGERKPVSIVEDCAIPLPRLAEFGAFVEDCFARHGTDGTWYAHASVGLLHVRPALNLKAARDVESFRAIAEEVLAEAVRLGGSWSGEHGDGILRSEFIERFAGERLARAFAEVKRAFDPQGIMNPGKIVDPPRMDDRNRFRYPPGYSATPLPMAGEAPRPADDSVPSPTLESGFARTVEACNNNGACRKMHGGAMCPSFRITREEAHTTRGRANALRLAMSGQLGVEGLWGDEVDAVLDLCVGCKACQRECPARVDVAWLKSRVLHLRHSARGLPLGERIFAWLPRAAPFLARLPWLANLPGRSRWLARLGERALGVAAERTLPEWRRPFRDRELPRPAPPPRRAVVLLADTFHRHFEPEIPRAAARVLRRLGYAPTAPAPHRRPLCCGRPLISAGLLDQARSELDRTLAALAPLARSGLPIVGLEPSCLLTLRDEALRLCPGDAAREVADRAQLLDEFLAGEAVAGAPFQANPFPAEPPSNPTAPRRPPTARIHGHCHQKAAGTETTTARALAIAGIRSKPIESSCCGMAGSFGYRARHLAVSRAMGELALMPAVRAAASGELIVANGFSCRAQILDGAGRRAHHLAEVLDRHLAGKLPATTAGRDRASPQPTPQRSPPQP